MIFSYSWLKELSGTKRSPQKLAELLMTHAFEVESVEKYQHGLENVVVGKVLTVTKHPNADRLRVAEVQTGKKEKRTIVCGAPNLAVGQRVAVALSGAHLPEGIVIKESELRGVVSQGMICSAKELGLGSDHEGILVLSEEAPVGKDFALYAGLDDTLLDVKILPDRSSDALSYRGLAREIAALEGYEAMFLKEAAVKKRAMKKSPRVPKVTLKTKRCERYVAVYLPKLNRSTTPLEVQARLILSGLRPLQPIVDLTNYLMLETGQPIHAFDADAIPAGGIVVREAKNREKLLLLDGTTLALSADDIVIADTKKPIALAGVMGGKHSAIGDKTKSVVFEIAHFDAPSIRRTEKRYRMLTDAAYRFERGIDLARSLEVMPLLTQYVEGWGLGKEMTMREVGGKLPKEKTIILELETVASLLGTKVPLFEVVQYCSWLGLSVKKLPNRQALSITVPLRRPDLTTPEDIIEEIGRMRGYDAIEPIPLHLPALPEARDTSKRFEREVKERLAAMGFDEVMTYSFYSEKSTEMSVIAKNDHLALANPMNPDQAYLRTSLFPNLFRSATQNTKNFEQFSFFEYGSVFFDGKTGPAEEKHIGILSFERESQSLEDSFLRFKAKIESLFAMNRLNPTWDSLATGAPAYFHPTRVAHISIMNESLGFAGVVHHKYTDRLGKRSVILYAEIPVKTWQALEGKEKIFRGISRFPLAERDISLIGPKDVSFARLKQVIQEAGAPLLLSSELFDVYTTEAEKSFALHLGFGSSERTLSSLEMDEKFEQIVRAAGEHLGMRLKL